MKEAHSLLRRQTRHERKDVVGGQRPGHRSQFTELRKISQGRAAEIAGLSRAEFIDALGRYGVSPFQQTATATPMQRTWCRVGAPDAS